MIQKRMFSFSVKKPAAEKLEAPILVLKTVAKLPMNFPRYLYSLPGTPGALNFVASTFLIAAA